MLPMNMFISNDDVQYICKSIKKFYSIEMAKRSLDLGISLVGLVILTLLITTLIIIWAQDFGNPFISQKGRAQW